jgi:hypothetical protein
MLYLDGRSEDCFQVGSNHLTEVGKMRKMPFTVEKRTAKLSFQLLNGTREGGLRNVALFSCTREVQFLCDRKKVTHLMHFHTGTPR